MRYLKRNGIKGKRVRRCDKGKEKKGKIEKKTNNLKKGKK